MREREGEIQRDRGRERKRSGGRKRWEGEKAIEMG